MQRRLFVKNSALVLSALSVFTNRTLAQLYADPTWKIKMLTDDIGIFTEKGGTILFYVSRDGMVVVDSQFPDTAPHLIDELKKKSSKPFLLLVNTHHHGDHTAGNIAFKGLVDRVLAHENSKINQEKVAKEKNNEDQQLYPNNTFGTIWCEKIGKEELCLHYYGEGHTNGDAIVQFGRADIIHMGDLMFNRRHPFVDRSAGASITNWITLLDKTYKNFNKKSKYVCGHAADGYEVVFGREDLKLFGDYLGKVLQFTESEIKAGKTKDEIIKTKDIPGVTEWKGDGLERPLSAAYDELTSK